MRSRLVLLTPVALVRGLRRHMTKTSATRPSARDRRARRAVINKGTGGNKTGRDAAIGPASAPSAAMCGPSAWRPSARPWPRPPPAPAWT